MGGKYHPQMVGLLLGLPHSPVSFMGLGPSVVASKSAVDPFCIDLYSHAIDRCISFDSLWNATWFGQNQKRQCLAATATFGSCCVILPQSKVILRFPKIGVPHPIIHFIFGFSLRKTNHFWGTSIYRNPKVWNINHFVEVKSVEDSLMPRCRWRDLGHLCLVPFRGLLNVDVLRDVAGFTTDT